MYNNYNGILTPFEVMVAVFDGSNRLVYKEEWENTLRCSVCIGWTRTLYIVLCIVIVRMLRGPHVRPKWKRRFQQFHLASGLAGDSEEKQVSTLLYCLGEGAEDRLASTTISGATTRSTTPSSVPSTLFSTSARM